MASEGLDQDLLDFMNKHLRTKGKRKGLPLGAQPQVSVAPTKSPLSPQMPKVRSLARPSITPIPKHAPPMAPQIAEPTMAERHGAWFSKQPAPLGRGLDEPGRQVVERRGLAREHFARQRVEAEAEEQGMPEWMRPRPSIGTPKGFGQAAGDVAGAAGEVALSGFMKVAEQIDRVDAPTREVVYHAIELLKGRDKTKRGGFLEAAAYGFSHPMEKGAVTGWDLYDLFHDLDLHPEKYESLGGGEKVKRALWGLGLEIGLSPLWFIQIDELAKLGKAKKLAQTSMDPIGGGAMGAMLKKGALTPDSVTRTAARAARAQPGTGVLSSIKRGVLGAREKVQEKFAARKLEKAWRTIEKQFGKARHLIPDDELMLGATKTAQVMRGERYPFAFAGLPVIGKRAGGPLYKALAKIRDMARTGKYNKKAGFGDKMAEALKAVTEEPTKAFWRTTLYDDFDELVHTSEKFTRGEGSRMKRLITDFRNEMNAAAKQDKLNYVKFARNVVRHEDPAYAGTAATRAMWDRYSEYNTGLKDGMERLGVKIVKRDEAELLYIHHLMTRKGAAEIKRHLMKRVPDGKHGAREISEFVSDAMKRKWDDTVLNINEILQKKTGSKIVFMSEDPVEILAATNMGAIRAVAGHQVLEGIPHLKGAVKATPKHVKASVSGIPGADSQLKRIAGIKRKLPLGKGKRTVQERAKALLSQPPGPVGKPSLGTRELKVERVEMTFGKDGLARTKRIGKPDSGIKAEGKAILGALKRKEYRTTIEVVQDAIADVDKAGKHMNLVPIDEVFESGINKYMSKDEFKSLAYEMYKKGDIDFQTINDVGLRKAKASWLVERPSAKGKTSADLFYLGIKQKPKAPSKAVAKLKGIVEGLKKKPSANTEKVMNMMRAIEPQADIGALVSFKDLRPEIDVPKAFFDDMLNQMRIDGHIHLHKHSHPAQATAEELSRYVKIGDDYFVGASLKKPAKTITETLKTPAKVPLVPSPAKILKSKMSHKAKVETYGKQVEAAAEANRVAAETKAGVKRMPKAPIAKPLPKPKAKAKPMTPSVAAKAVNDPNVLAGMARDLHKEGFVKEAGIGPLPYGYRRLAHEKLQQWAFPTDLADVIDAHYVKIKKAGFHEDKISRVMNFMKAQALMTPRYHMRNAIGDTQNMWYGGTKLHEGVADMAESTAVQHGYNPTIVAPGGKFGGMELWDQAERGGLFASGLFTKDLDPATFWKNWNPLEANRRVGGYLENKRKFALFLNRVKKGDSVVDAIKHSQKYLFDYAHISPKEETLRKWVVYFYTYLRKNTALQAETILTQPAKQMVTARVIRGFNEYLRSKGVEDENPDLLSEYLKKGAVRTSSRTDEKGHRFDAYLIWNQWLPQSDANKAINLVDAMVKGAPTEFIREFVGTGIESLHPVWKEPIEQCLNYDTFFLGPIDRLQAKGIKGSQTTQFMGYTMSRREAHWFRNLTLLGALDKLNPGEMLGTPTKRSPISGEFREAHRDPSSFYQLMRFFGGINMVDVDITDQTMKAGRRGKGKISALKSQLKWMTKEMLRQGRDPDTIEESEAVKNIRQLMKKAYQEAAAKAERKGK